MSSIYLHIPFCKRKCHYCDFHFSTSLKNKEAMISALSKELALRKDEINEPVESIYLGGGTPSLLSVDEIAFLISEVYKNYSVSSTPEITLEANPDDLTEEKIKQLAQTPVNRLSIGVQSFFDDDLRLMNRAHSAVESERCLNYARAYFHHLTIDLIYGIPGMTEKKWQHNIEKALSFAIPHLSAYALTVEPKTALEKFIKKGIIGSVDEVEAEQHYRILIEIMTKNGYVNYEFSNFGKLGYFSRNNTAYWTGKQYIGIGPSAHSFDGKSRSWNISNNLVYIRSLEGGQRPFEAEILTVTDRYNEYIMTGLRTMFGVSLEKVKSDFGESYYRYLLEQAERFTEKGLLELEENILKVTSKGKFIGDGISAELFF